VILASRLRTLAMGTALLAAAGASAVAACTSSTTTTTFTPITGIEIQSASLVAGFGCGTEPNQVFRYVAVLNFASGLDGGGVGAPVFQSGVPLTNIFECFSDGVFENLPTSDAGSLTFKVSVFAYSQSAYEAAGLPEDLGCPPIPDAGFCTPSSTPVTASQEDKASWKTLCTATQQAGTPVIAMCPPLVSTTEAPETDAAIDAARDGALDAAPDATSAAPDASNDAEPPDGAAAEPDGAPVDGAPVDGALVDGAAE
jgi:hypothetical protein